MKRLRRLGAAAVLSAILTFATASASLARHHHHHWGWYHHYYGGRAGSWNSHPRNAESA
jgi:hypothetical protein